MLGKFPEHIYQYTFGDEMLVAPVYEKGATTQKIFLPNGKWINYWTGENMQGNAEYTVAAPINQIPLFVKQGSIIPMRNYASSIEKGNNNILILHIFPGKMEVSIWWKTMVQVMIISKACMLQQLLN